jgi:hypothetical protein
MIKSLRGVENRPTAWPHAHDGAMATSFGARLVGARGVSVGSFRCKTERRSRGFLPIKVWHGGHGGTTPVRLATGALLSNRRLTERAILGSSSAAMKVKLGSRHLVEAPCAGGEAQRGNGLVRQWRG